MKRYNKLSEPESNGDLKQTVAVTRDAAERRKEAPEIAKLLANEQAARRETEIVRDANIALTQDLSLHKVLETLLDYLHKLVAYDSANVMLLEGDSKFVVSALRNYDRLQDMEPLRTLTLDLSTYQSLQRICTTRRSVVVADTCDDPAWKHITGAEHIRNWLGVPLVAYGEVIGLYSLDKAEPWFFTKEHVGIAETLAAPAASAIQNARLFQQTKRYAADLEKRISETKEAEEALRASEERYRELFENARDAVYVHDLNGLYLSVNRAAEKLTGYSREEIIGRHFSEFVEPSHVARLQKRLSMKLIFQGGTSYEVDLVTRDQRRVPVEVSSNLIYEKGVPVGVQGIVRDISERRRAEMAVRDAERKYQDIFENAGEGIFQSTPAGQFIAANPELARIHGFDSPAELIQSLRDISRQIYVNSERREEFKRLLEKEGVVRGFEHQVFRKDGSKIWVAVNARAVRDELGTVIYYEGTAQDITERKRVEEQLRQSEGRFRQLAESITEVFWMTNPDKQQMLYVSPAYEKIWGRTCESLYEQPTAWIDAIHPDDQDRVKRLLLTQQIQGEYDVEFRIIRPDGSVRWIRDRAFPIKDKSGRVYRITGIAEDITEGQLAEKKLRESEERFSKAFHSTPAALCIAQLNDSRVLEVNAAFMRITGYSSAEVIGKSTREIGLWVEPDCQMTMTQTLLERGAEADLEIKFRMKSGELRDGLLAVDLIELEGQPCVLGIIQDVTLRKKSELALRSFSRMLIEAQEAERQSVARELHDQIGQVLTAVRINLQTTQDECKASEEKSLISESITTVDVALDQVRNLSFELRPSLLDDLGLVTALRWYADRHARRSGLRTKTAIEFPEGVRLDRELETACFRIVQEALTNVARHAGARNVSLSLERLKDEILLTIKDDGGGFDVENVNARSFPVNLGLRGMEERALALGGRLEIKSAPSRGTEICAYFPHED